MFKIGDEVEVIGTTLDGYQGPKVGFVVSCHSTDDYGNLYSISSTERQHSGCWVAEHDLVFAKKLTIEDVLGGVL